MHGNAGTFVYTECTGKRASADVQEILPCTKENHVVNMN